MFDVDFNLIAYQLTPHFLRGPKSLALLNTAFSGLKSINTLFLSLVDNIRYKLTFSAQTIYLEHILNDKYDNIGRGIYIDTLSVTNFIYLFQELEEKPLYLFNDAEAQPDLYLQNLTEYVGGTNFIINVPVAVSYDSNLMKKDVNVYNLAYKKYTIQTY